VATRGSSGILCLGRVGATALTPNEIGSNFVNAVKIGLQVVLVLSSLLLTLLVLLHKGKGGGLSDMFGGGMSSTMSGSSVAERNLDRFTVALGLVWGATVVGLDLIAKYNR
jgi:preprotein translocase subunit SecG